MLEKLDRANRKVNFYIQIFVIFTILLLVPYGNSTAENKSHQYNNKPHLFAYSEKHIQGYLNKAGYSDYEFNYMERNALGTNLYISISRKGKRDDEAILSISSKGEIKKIIPPSRRWFLNDKNEFIAWFNNKGVQFKDGTNLDSQMFGKVLGDFRVDPSGEYFFIKRQLNLIEVANVNNPNKVLFTAEIEAENIFYKNNKIYLFARNRQNVKGPGDYEQHEVVCHIYKLIETGFILEEIVHIPRPSPRSSPFAVVDMDPWSDKVLLIDVRDVPFHFFTAWYLFDLKTKEMIKIGRAKDYGFFLETDILKQK